MRLFGLDLSWSRPEAKAQTLSLDQLIRRLEAVYETVSGIAVTPDTALLSPTVQAVVRAVSAKISTLPVHVFVKSLSRGRTKKELLANHPVARLLSQPNERQDRVSYWLDAVSWLMRYGRFYAFKARGVTGPIRRLEPLPPAHVTEEQQDDLSVLYRVHRSQGESRMYTRAQIHHARGMSRDGVIGDSPVMNARESIALEIAAEKFGGAFFGNGAMPALIFQYIASGAGHRTEEDRKQFIEDVQQAYTGRGRFRAMLLPKGVEVARDPIALDNDKAQFLQTRQYQRTVIAGAFGVPPHLVGDLTKGTYNNVEQQSLDFVQNVVLPYVRIFEAAMERDLLTDDDRAGGVIIRFNLDGALRGDFQTRQQGLKIMREAGVINPNEWREREDMNPREGGDEYWDQGPSGQGPGGRRMADAEPARADEDTDEDEPVRAASLAGRNGGGR
jgi:HK97 family phage portal protein